MGFYKVSRFVGFALGSGLALTFLHAFGTRWRPDAGCLPSDGARSVPPLVS